MGSQARDGTLGLWRTARRLKHFARRRASTRTSIAALPPLIFVTDPTRTPEPEAIAARLPRGAGVIYRAFGAADALAAARRLRAIADTRGLVFLVGADEALAAAAGADGLHLPEAMAGRARRIRARRPGWILTGAAHSPRALAKAASLGLDAALFSTVFESRSPSAGTPWGAVRFAGLVRGARLPVYALGGVTMKNARRLEASGAVGLAAVESLRT